MRRDVLLGICGVFFGVWILTPGGQLRAAEQTSGRPWFTSLPPAGAPVDLTALNRIPPSGNVSSVVMASNAGEIYTLSNTGAVLRSFRPYGTAYRGPINFGVGSFAAGNTSAPVLFAVPAAPSDLPLTVFQINGPVPAKLDDIPGVPDINLGGMTVAVGNIIGDATNEIVLAAGPGARGRVHIIQLGRDDVFTFEPFGDFTGGVRVAMGDLDGDHFDELITSQANGGEVRVWQFLQGIDPVMVGDGFPFPSPSGGVWTTALDVNNDGCADLITSAGSGDPRVRIFSVSDPTPTILGDFAPFAPGTVGGVRIAAGLDQGHPGIITAAERTIHIFKVQSRDWHEDEDFDLDPDLFVLATLLDVHAYTPKK